jgi:hypothetical protein
LAACGSFDPPPGPLAGLVEAPLEAINPSRAAKVHSGPRDRSSVGDALRCKKQKLNACGSEFKAFRSVLQHINSGDSDISIT